MTGYKEISRKEVYVAAFAIIALAIFAVFALNNNSSLPLTGYIVKDAAADQAVNVSAITKEQAFAALLQAEHDMQEMLEAGLGVSLVNDTLLEARKAFEGENYAELLRQADGINDTRKKEFARQLLLKAQTAIAGGQKAEVNYTLVIEKAGAIAERKARGFLIKDSLRVAELGIAEANRSGLSISEAAAAYAAAKEEFGAERYEAAERPLAQIDSRLADARAEATLVRTIYNAGRDTFVSFVRANSRKIAISLTILVMIALLFANQIKIGILKNKLKSMRTEQDVLTELIKKAQTDYYQKQAISKQTFDVKTAYYKKGVLQIKRELPVVEERLRKLYGKRLI